MDVLCYSQSEGGPWARVLGDWGRKPGDLDGTLTNISQCEYRTSKTFGTRVFAGDQIQTLTHAVQLLSTTEPRPRAGVINLVTISLDY